MTAASHFAMLERRLTYLTDHVAPHPMAEAEKNALRWALPLLRPTVAAEAKRQHLGLACPACSAPAGFTCAHLPRRT